MKRKGAIELTANFLVVIIISAVIVVGGLAMFFKLKASAETYVKDIDSQTEERIKSMMLNNNGRVAVYPNDLTIAIGDGHAVGLGITNSFTDPKDFKIVVKVKYYAPGAENSVSISETDYYSMLQPSTINILQGDQIVKSIVLKIPKVGSEGKGQYVYTLKVQYVEAGVDTDYDTVQVYVNTP
jgi:hypothetical protein